MTLTHCYAVFKQVISLDLPSILLLLNVDRQLSISALRFAGEAMFTRRICALGTRMVRISGRVPQQTSSSSLNGEA